MKTLNPKIQDDIREDIQRTINRFDSPFYFYDLDKLHTHLSEIAGIIDPDIKLWYACKANPMSAILKILRNLKFGIDIASTGELQQVLNVGIKGEEIISTGPGKSKDYLAHLLNNNVKTIVIESLNQLTWLNQVAIEQDKTVNVLLRIQLDWNEGKSVLGGNSITPFGLGPDDWSELNTDHYKNINFKGFHIFQWGNIMSAAKLKEIWESAIIQIKSLADKLAITPEIFDLGGGLGVPYNFEDKPIEFKDVHDILVELKNKYQIPTIWLELGRFTVANSGKYLTKILDKKTVRGKNILVTEGGINHCARVALTGESFPCSALNEYSSETLNYQVHGPLCTSLDKLGEFDLPKDIQVGDWLVFHQAGAYGFTESMPFFLCHTLPGEVIRYKGDVVVPRPPKTSFDWMI